MHVGGVSAPVPSCQFGFCAGSAPGVIVVPELVADFQVPKILVGVLAVVLSLTCCQSPARLFAFDVMSVTNIAGKSGRPNGSVAVRSPTFGFD